MKQNINIKVFNIIKINKVKTFLKHISCDFKYKFSCTTYTSNQKWNNDKCQCECRTCKKVYSWNLAHVFVRIIGIQKVF